MDSVAKTKGNRLGGFCREGETSRQQGHNYSIRLKRNGSDNRAARNDFMGNIKPCVEKDLKPRDIVLATRSTIEELSANRGCCYAELARYIEFGRHTVLEPLDPQSGRLFKEFTILGKFVVDFNQDQVV